MHIGFSTFVMQGGRSGVAAYIRELVRYLQLEDRANTYEVLAVRSMASLLPLSNPNFRATLFPDLLDRPVLNIFWHNTGLPLSGRTAKMEVLHIPSYRRIPAIKNTRIVATVHDLATLSIDAKYDPARMFYNHRIVPKLIRGVDRIITVSQYTKNDIIRFTGYPEEKIHVIYSGIDHARFHPLDRSVARAALAEKHGIHHPFFVYVSRLEHPAKNHTGLIEAFERFKRKNNSPHLLVLAGADWNGADQIRARIAASPVRESIIELGFAPLESLPQLYSACELMIFPSFFEGFGFPIVEALACGAPVICSDTSSMREIAGDLVTKFDPRQPEAITTAIETALRTGWTEAQRQAACAYAARFDWHACARDTIAVYEQTAGTSG